MKSASLRLPFVLAWQTTRACSVRDLQIYVGWQWVGYVSLHKELQSKD